MARSGSKAASTSGRAAANAFASRWSMARSQRASNEYGAVESPRRARIATWPPNCAAISASSRDLPRPPAPSTSATRPSLHAATTAAEFGSRPIIRGGRMIDGGTIDRAAVAATTPAALSIVFRSASVSSLGRAPKLILDEPFAALERGDRTGPVATQVVQTHQPLMRVLLQRRRARPVVPPARSPRRTGPRSRAAMCCAASASKCARNMRARCCVNQLSNRGQSLYSSPGSSSPARPTAPGRARRQRWLSASDSISAPSTSSMPTAFFSRCSRCRKWLRATSRSASGHSNSSSRRARRLSLDREIREHAGVASLERLRRARCRVDHEAAPSRFRRNAGEATAGVFAEERARTVAGHGDIRAARARRSRDRRRGQVELFVQSDARCNVDRASLRRSTLEGEELERAAASHRAVEGTYPTTASSRTTLSRVPAEATAAPFRPPHRSCTSRARPRRAPRPRLAGR